MKDLFEFALKNIVGEPDQVEITESDEDGVTTVKLTVAEADMGKIIGKGGKVIKSLRTLAKIYSIKKEKKFYLELEDSSQQNAAPD